MSDTTTTDTTIKTVGMKSVSDSIVTVSNTNGFIKSRQRTSFKEFVIKKKLRPEIRAGFQVWLHGQMHFFDNEWEQKFNEYTNRKIQRREK